MNKVFRRTVLVSALLTTAVVQAGWGDLLKSAEQGLQGVTGQSSAAEAVSGLTSGQIDAGLKEALSIGAERAIALLGKTDGFLKDKSVRIPLPDTLDKVAGVARSMGQNELVDEFELTVNRAAEKAIPETLDIVKQVVEGMTLKDAQGILNGSDDAATQYLRKKGGPKLIKRIKPLISEATDAVGATSAYKNLVAVGQDQLGGVANSLGGTLGSLGQMAGGMVDSGSLDLDSYVTDKTLDGLFLKLAAEEKKIRKDPVARSTDLLKQVFK